MSKIVLNEVTGQREMHLEGKLTKISNKVLENSNGTEYRIGDVDIVYPDGNKDTVSASIWEKNIESGLFQADMRVNLAVQLEGEYSGFAKVELAGGKRVDITKFDLGTTTDAPVVATEA